MHLQSALLIAELAIYPRPGYVSVLHSRHKGRNGGARAYYTKTMAMIHLALSCREVRGVEQSVCMQLGEQINCY
jgi:hypothetical protein